MSEKNCLAFAVRVGVVVLPLISLLGCGGAGGQPFGGGGFLGRGSGGSGEGGIVGTGGAPPAGGAMGSAGAGGSAGQAGSGGKVATGGSATGGTSTGGVGGGAVGGKAAGGDPGTGGTGAGGKAAGGNAAGGRATGGTPAGGAGGKASGGTPGTGGMTSTGGTAGHPTGGAGGSSGAGGTAPDCTTLAKQYDAEMQKSAKNCTTNTVGACSLKVPQDLSCQNSCITWVQDSSGRLQQIYKTWQDEGCLKRAPICTMLVACLNPRGASCVADIISTDTLTSAAVVAPAIGLPGVCQDDRTATTQ